MNALANSQEGELEKYLCRGFREPRVRFARYTGQDDDAARKRIVEDPPDILLTNYVMLELMLTRPHEAALVRAAEGLRFLVFDELHTYRGRQGADVALLIRRARAAFKSDDLLCAGTSATMSTKGTWQEQQAGDRGGREMRSSAPGSRPRNVIRGRSCGPPPESRRTLPPRNRSARRWLIGSLSQASTRRG
ncbi:MAG: hypothetical protein IPG04_10470 [Polyangiaceae bacterium]|nr:hypothetical protein [Polyangiaceae bacterium]